MITLPILTRPLILCATVLGLSVPALAHEFWIAPDQYQLAPGETLTAHFKNGENFIGFKLGFFDKRSRRLEYALGAETLSLTPRLGDIPVIDMAAPGDGLMVIVHETAPESITYEAWDKFQSFADHKGFVDIRARHDARGLPRDGFTESYTRHAKALIGIGPAQGADRRMGLQTEFVALTNPYTDDLSQGLTVALYAEGAPRPDAQIEIFARAPDGTVTVITQQTDSAGQAVIPVTSGFEYLLDAVVLRPAPEGAEHVWETLWAALTFRAP